MTDMGQGDLTEEALQTFEDDVRDHSGRVAAAMLITKDEYALFVRTHALGELRIIFVREGIARHVATVPAPAPADATLLKLTDSLTIGATIVRLHDLESLPAAIVCDREEYARFIEAVQRQGIVVLISDGTIFLIRWGNGEPPPVRKPQVIQSEDMDWLGADAAGGRG